MKKNTISSFILFSISCGFLATYVIAEDYSLQKLGEMIHTDMNADLKRDTEKFKKSPYRKPSSIGEAEKVIPLDHLPEKIEKNVKQIGPKHW